MRAIEADPYPDEEPELKRARVKLAQHEANIRALLAPQARKAGVSLDLVQARAQLADLRKKIRQHGRT